MSSSSAMGHDHGHGHGEHHITPLPVYFAVYGALLVLTVVTVGVSYLGLPPLQSISVAMAVALVKASLVGAWFMHLKYDAKFNVFTFLAALWFMASFFVFTFFDLASRDMVNQVTGQHVLHKDMDERKK
jgi:cytochrome c oxidase subunit 4